MAFVFITIPQAAKGISVPYFVNAPYTEVQSTQVGDICADFYQADGEASSNMLVWSSAENDLVFYIMADIPESTMIKMAEGVQKK